MTQQPVFHPSPRQRALFHQLLLDNLGALSGDQLELLGAQSQWQACSGGEILFPEGGPGDAAYFLISGRLRAVKQTPHSKPQLLGDIKPGETVGEIAVLTDTKRGATVLAARDSVVVRVDAQHLKEWFIAYPYLLSKIAKLVIKRNASGSKQNRRDDHVSNITVVGVTPSVDMVLFLARLEVAINPYGKVLILSAADLDRLANEPGLSATDSNGTDSFDRLNTLLEALEEAHNFVIYCANLVDDAWTNTCLRRADRMILLADSLDDCQPSEFERTLLQRTGNRLISNSFLAINHPPNTRLPSGAAAWLSVRPWITEPIHVRANDVSHMSRLARLITGNAIGLVLGSGGARGLSHVGVFRALAEAGIPIDRIGGTSIGSIVGAIIACDLTPSEIASDANNSFGKNPTSLLDLSLMPIFAMYTGKRVNRLLSEVFPDNVCIEDLWINYFCVTCDISSYTQMTHMRGPLIKAIRASAALPGIFPPVRLGDGLHIDGAFMNALPVDVMGSMGAHQIIASDLASQKKITFEFEQTPTPLEFFINKYIRRNKLRYRVPTIMSAIVQSSLIASAAKAKQDRNDVDILFNPDVHKYNLMAWSHCSKLMDIGYQHGLSVLATHPLTPDLIKHRASPLAQAGS